MGVLPAGAEDAGLRAARKRIVAGRVVDYRKGGGGARGAKKNEVNCCDRVQNVSATEPNDYPPLRAGGPCAGPAARRPPALRRPALRSSRSCRPWRLSY